MPAGKGTSGEYRLRGLGSVVPCLRWREPDDEAPGVVRYGFMARIATIAGTTDQQTSGTDAEQIRNGKTPVGKGWNGENGFSVVVPKEESGVQCDTSFSSNRGIGSPEPVSSVPSVPQADSRHSPSVLSPPVSIPDAVPRALQACELDRRTGMPVLVDGEGGWQLPGALPQGNGPTVSVLVIAPNGTSRLIERQRISLPPESSAA